MSMRLLTVEPGDALERDTIAGTVDYGTAFGVIERIVTGERHLLIETLALSIGKALTAEIPQVAARRSRCANPTRPSQAFWTMPR